MAGSATSTRCAIRCCSAPLSAAISTVIAVPMAWAVSRTDMPGKGFTWAMVLAAFIMPPYLGAIGWILLAGPNAGWINVTWRALTGAEPDPLQHLQLHRLAFVIALHSFPLVFIFMKSALDLISSEMEDAANILGAGTWTTMRRVTLPLVWPSILGGFILIFLEAIALFGSPAIIGIPARINVVTTQLWQFFEYPVRVEVAAAYAMPLLLITVGDDRRAAAACCTARASSRRPARAASAAGASSAPGAGCCSAGACWSALLSVFMPLIVLLQAAFAKAWGRGFSLDNLTLRNYRFLLFEHDVAPQATWNTVRFSGGLGHACAIVLALLVAYIVMRRLVRFAGVLGFLAMAPFVIPGIVLAIGFYAAYAAPPLSLYGTALLIILAFTTRFLPIAYANSQRGDPRSASGDGGSRAHPRLRPPARHPAHHRAAAQDVAAGRLAGGVHRGVARIVARRSSWSGRARGPCRCCCSTSASRATSRCVAAFGGILLVITMRHRRHRHEAGRPRLHAAEGIACRDLVADAA